MGRLGGFNCFGAIAGSRGQQEGVDVRLHRNCPVVGRAQPLLHSRGGARRRSLPTVRDIPGQDARGPDRAAEVEVGQLKYRLRGPRAPGGVPVIPSLS